MSGMPGVVPLPPAAMAPALTALRRCNQSTSRTAAAATLTPTDTQAHSTLPDSSATTSRPKAIRTRTSTRSSTVSSGQAARRGPASPRCIGWSAAGVGTLAVPRGGIPAVRRGAALGRCGRAAALQVAKLGLQVGLEPGPVLALEGPQLVDLLLEDRLVAGDAADDLGLLALGVADQLSSLVAALPLQGLGPGAGVVEHRLGTRACVVDQPVGLRPGVAQQLLGLVARVRQHGVGLALGLGREPVGHLLSEAQDLRGLDVVVTAHVRATAVVVRTRIDHPARLHRPLRHRRGRLGALHLLRRRRHLPHPGLWTRARLLQVRVGVAEPLVELRDLLAQVVVLLDQPRELGLHEVQEGVDLVFVVPPLTNRGLAERDVVHVSGRQRHRITSCSPRRRNRVTGAHSGYGWATLISMNTTSSRTIIDRSSPTPPIRTTGITLRNNFTGGSVTVKITSRATALGPTGTHCRAKLRTISATMRARRSSQKKNSA